MSSAKDRATRATVQIWTPDSRLGEAETLCGTGFLVGRDLVLTCAHVVAKALGAADDRDPGPEGTVLVTFPYGDQEGPWPARHETGAWVAKVPGGAGDIAVLRLAGQPSGIVPLPLTPEAIPDTGGVETICWGFPDPNNPRSIRSALCELRPGEPYGVPSDAATWQRVIKRAGKGDAFIDPGFSGAPLFTDPDYRVAGMVCADIPNQDQEAACVAVADLARVLDGVAGRHRPARKGAIDRTDLLRIDRHQQVGQVKRFLHLHRKTSRDGDTRPGVVVILGQDWDRPGDFFQRWQKVHFEEEAVPFGRSMDFLGSAKLPFYEEPDPVWAFVDLLSHLLPASSGPAGALDLDDVACEASLSDALAVWQASLARDFYLQWDVDCTEWSPAHARHLQGCLDFVARCWPALPPDRAGLIFLVVTFDNVVDERLALAHPFFKALGDELGCGSDRLCCVDLFTNVTAVDLRDWRKAIGEERVAPTLWDPLHAALEAARLKDESAAAEKTGRGWFSFLGRKAAAPVAAPFVRKPGLTLDEAIRMIEKLKDRTGGTGFAEPAI
ncbi:MAG: serine protease [Alphaproteobacteria bacterium]